jgi:hypothetical protein
MEQYNKDNVADRAPLTEDALEALIDLYEKEAFILSPDAGPAPCARGGRVSPPTSRSLAR